MEFYLRVFIFRNGGSENVFSEKNYVLIAANTLFTEIGFSGV